MLEKKFKEVRLELDPNKTFLLRPTILMLFEKALLEPGDWIDIESKKNKSPWHKLVFENAKFLIDEGIIELKPAPIPLGIRSIIKEGGNSIVEYENPELKLALVKHAWNSFKDYITIKTHFVRSNQTLLVDHISFMNDIDKIIHKYSQTNAIKDFDAFDNLILKQIVWKSYASIEIALKENIPLYMAMEYRPFISWLLKKTSGAKTIIPEKSIEDIEKIDELLLFVSSFNYPSVRLETDKDKKAFLKLRRESWMAFNNLCNELNEIIEQCRHHDIILAKQVIQQQSIQAVETIHKRIKQLSSFLFIGTFISKVLLHEYDKPHSLADQTSNLAYDKIVRKRFPFPKAVIIPWYQAAAETFSKQETDLINLELRKKNRSSRSVNSSLDYWFYNPERIPWYIDTQSIH